jgi:hypothetical protein
VWRALCPLVIARGHSQMMLRTPSGPSTDGGSDGQKRLQIYRPAAIMWTPCVLGACCLTSLAHMQCVGPAGIAVTGDRYSRYIKITQNTACYTKGYQNTA